MTRASTLLPLTETFEDEVMMQKANKAFVRVREDDDGKLKQTDADECIFCLCSLCWWQETSFRIRSNRLNVCSFILCFIPPKTGQWLFFSADSANSVTVENDGRPSYRLRPSQNKIPVLMPPLERKRLSLLCLHMVVRFRLKKVCSPLLVTVCSFALHC